MRILGIIFIIISLSNLATTILEWLMTYNFSFIHLITAVLFGILGLYWIHRAKRMDKARKLHDKHRKHLLELQKEG